MHSITEISGMLTELENYLYILPSMTATSGWTTRDDITELNKVIIFQLNWANKKIQYMEEVITQCEAQLNAIEIGLSVH